MRPYAIHVYIYVLSGRKPDWETSKQLLRESNFIKQLQHFEKDKIDRKRLQALQKYIEMPDFTYTKIASVSKAAAGLCMWVQGILKVRFCYSLTRPQRHVGTVPRRP